MFLPSMTVTFITWQGSTATCEIVKFIMKPVKLLRSWYLQSCLFQLKKNIFNIFLTFCIFLKRWLICLCIIFCFFQQLFWLLFLVKSSLNLGFLIIYSFLLLNKAKNCLQNYLLKTKQCEKILSNLNSNTCYLCKNN